MACLLQALTLQATLVGWLGPAARRKRYPGRARYFVALADAAAIRGDYEENAAARLHNHDPSATTQATTRFPSLFPIEYQ
ncbi:hypothetical protein BGW80DRAFT_1459796 [Lactifluus volemus]|nr:hypothetical protein BGW80DRAFT_1459796 [Lactifluus volemus]